MSREVKALLLALLIGVLLLGGFGWLHMASTPEKKPLDEEGEAIPPLTEQLKEKGKAGKQKQNLLEAIHDKEQNKAMKEQLRIIRESSR